MDTWLSFLKSQPEEVFVDNSQLCDLFTFDIAKPQIAALQASMASLNEDLIHRQVGKANLLDNDWPGFVALVKAYLAWCAYIDPQKPQLCFESYAKCFIALQQAYANPRGACLNQVAINLTKQLLKLFTGGGKLYLEWISSGLLKLLNSVRTEREPPAPPAPAKRDIALFCANMLSRAYFRSGQFVSAGNVFNNMHSMGVELSQFPMSEQVEYRFWLGRYLLYTNDVYGAYTSLQWSLEHCLFPSQQYYLILDWLVVPALLVGKMPSESLINMLSLPAQLAVRALAYVIRRGVLSNEILSSIEQNPWIVARYLQPVLDMYFRIAVYRRGLKRLLMIMGGERPRFNLARVAFGLKAEDTEMLVTESVLNTLISSGMVRGKVLPKTQMLVVKQKGGVPPLTEVYRRTITDREKWMN